MRFLQLGCVFIHKRLDAIELAGALQKFSNCAHVVRATVERAERLILRVADQNREVSQENPHAEVRSRTTTENRELTRTLQGKPRVEFDGLKSTAVDRINERSGRNL
jgi:hypothetical protein